MALNWMLARDTKSGSWVARKQIPARLRPAYTAAFGKGWAEKFARPASLSEQEARVAFAEWLAEVEGRIHFVTAGLHGRASTSISIRNRWITTIRWRDELRRGSPNASQHRKEGQFLAHRGL